MGVIQRASTPRVGKYSSAELNPEVPPWKSNPPTPLLSSRVSTVSQTCQVAIAIAVRVFEGERVHLGPVGEKRKMGSNLIDGGGVPPGWGSKQKVRKEQEQSQCHLWIPRKMYDLKQINRSKQIKADQNKTDKKSHWKYPLCYMHPKGALYVMMCHYWSAAPYIGINTKKCNPGMQTRSI